MNFIAHPKLKKSQVTALALLLLAVSPALCLAADELLKFSAAKPIPLILEVQRVKSPGKEEVKPSALVQIKAAKIGEASIFPLQEPTRIVIDLPASAAMATKNLTPKDNPLLAAVRIGSPPGKLRIVLHLKSSAPANFNIAKGSEALTVFILDTPPLTKQAAAPSPTPAESIAVPPPGGSVTPPGLARPESPTTAISAPQPTFKSISLPEASPTEPPLRPTETSTATATPTPAPPTPSPSPTQLPPTASPIPATPTATPQPTVIPPTITPATRPQETIPPAITPAATTAPQKQALTAIDFDNVQLDQSPAFRLVLTARPQFKLAKKDERSYTLTIPQCSVATDYLKLPYFPPQNLNGFTHVLARQSGADAEVTIGVERGTRIMAIARDTSIVVRSLTR